MKGPSLLHIIRVSAKTTLCPALETARIAQALIMATLANPTEASTITDCFVKPVYF
jgi:hypothetical protein